MAPSLRHRKLISPSSNTTTFFSLCVFECDPFQNPTHLCSHDCTLFCPSYCLPSPTPTPSPTPSPATSPHPHPFPPPSHHRHLPLPLPLKISLIFLFTTLIYTLYKFYTICHRSTPPPENQEINDDYDYTDGVVVDHPIWYIRTTGLQLSVINSLKVVRFSKLDGTTVEGTDCSVCLTEFEQGDVLRLLPNCNHAFHVACIDTWLRSHTNCPLCRAVIVNNSVDGTSSSEGHNDGLGFTGEVNVGVLVGDRGEASGSSGIRIGETDEDERNDGCLKT